MMSRFGPKQHKFAITMTEVRFGRQGANLGDRVDRKLVALR